MEQEETKQKINPEKKEPGHEQYKEKHSIQDRIDALNEELNVAYDELGWKNVDRIQIEMNTLIEQQGLKRTPTSKISSNEPHGRTADKIAEERAEEQRKKDAYEKKLEITTDRLDSRLAANYRNQEEMRSWLTTNESKKETHEKTKRELEDLIQNITDELTNIDRNIRVSESEIEGHGNDLYQKIQGYEKEYDPKDSYSRLEFDSPLLKRYRPNTREILFESGLDEIIALKQELRTIDDKIRSSARPEDSILNKVRGAVKRWEDEQQKDIERRKVISDALKEFNEKRESLARENETYNNHQQELKRMKDEIALFNSSQRGTQHPLQKRHRSLLETRESIMKNLQARKNQLKDTQLLLSTFTSKKEYLSSLKSEENDIKRELYDVKTRKVQSFHERKRSGDARDWQQTTDKYLDQDFMKGI